ncbi:MAG: hypothetical protein DRI92_03340, partial [Aquificota bacterium]
RNDYFGVGNQTAFGSGYSAAAHAYGSGAAWDTELWSPPVFLPDNATLTYASNFQDYAGNGDIWLDISADGGNTWDNLRYQTSDDPPGGTFEVVDLSTYTGQTVILRWRYSATSSTAWYWHIDDVSIGVPAPWLSVAPAAGTTAPVSESVTSVNFDAGQVDEPGDYYAALSVRTNDPSHLQAMVPVTMHVNLPASYGRLVGTVTGLGHCDANPLPLPGADVTVEGSDGQTWNLVSGVDGSFALWLDQAHSPLTVTVAATDHETWQMTGVLVTGTQTTTVNAALHWLAPCAGVEPAGISAVVEMGMTDTVPFSITNNGFATMTWSLVEENGYGFQVAAPMANTILLMMEDIAAADRDAYRNALTAAGVTWDEWDLNAQPFPTAGDLAPYDVLIWADESTLSPGDSSCQVVADWLTSGGKSLFATSVDFLWDLQNGTLGQGEHNLYLLFNTTYLGDYAGTGITTLEGVTGDPIGGGMTLSLAGNSDSDGDYADETTGAPAGFLYGAGDTGSGHSALTHYVGANYKTVWLGLNFHNGLATQAERDQLMSNILTFLSGGGAVAGIPWLTEVPTTGVTGPDSAFVVDAVFDAGVSEVEQPGEYYGVLTLNSDDPVSDSIAIPVTMTVTAPATWANVRGTVIGVDGCGNNPVPLDDAQVLLVAQGSAGLPFTLTTDVSGTFTYWLDEAWGPLNIYVTYPGYEDGEMLNVVITGSETITANFTLRQLAPCVNVTPSGIEISLAQGASTDVALNLGNTGIATALFSILEENLGVTPLAPLAAGGPDGFGYRYADSNQGGVAPTYAFHDISGFGTPLGLDDDDFAEVPIGFSFRFYGTDAAHPNTYNSVFVGSNGLLSFGSGSTDLSPDVIPDPALPNNIIASMWSDLRPGANGEVYYQTFNDCPYNQGVASDACLVVQYDDYEYADGSLAGTWQVILYRTGNILMQFEDVTAVGVATGIEDQLGIVGLNYVPAPADELAICFAYPGQPTDCQPVDIPWLDVDPVDGEIAPESSMQVTVTLDAGVPEVNDPGTYRGQLLVLSNDPLNSPTVVPVTMTVTRAAGKLAGTVVGWGYCDTISEPLAGVDVWIEGFTGAVWKTTTDANGYYQIWLDESDNPYELTVAVPGYVMETRANVDISNGSTITEDFDLHLDVPCVDLTPDEGFEVTINEGESLTRTLTLINKGAGVLVYTDINADSPWMSVSPTSGTVPPHSSQDVVLTVDASGLEGDRYYYGVLQVMHNDEVVGTIRVPVNVTISGESLIYLPLVMRNH